MSSSNQKQQAGILDIVDDGYGFLRFLKNDYATTGNDVYVNGKKIDKYNLRTGDKISGITVPPEKEDDYDALKKIKTVNDVEAKKIGERSHFGDLTPLYPEERFQLETKAEDTSTRIMDLFTPIGKGQRGLIVSPPRAGKTVLLQKVANSIHENHPEAFVIILLIDERPEEVTDMERNVSSAEVVASTFDETAHRHTQVAETVIERAKRLVEQKEDVVILLDSITRLARSYNLTQPSSGKVLSGGVDSNALNQPKKFFGAARNIEEGGSLTILATALIETGSQMDDVIFEEFKGTGNMEVQLERELANKRIYPAINLHTSGTRKEELLLNEEVLNKMRLLRRGLGELTAPDAMELVLSKINDTDNNDEFIKQISE